MRVALTHLTIQLLRIRIHERLESTDPISPTAAARYISHPHEIPVRYADLCELCRKLLVSMKSPVLVLWDAVELLKPPLDGTRIIDPNDAPVVRGNVTGR